jgi:hypothetical protein
MKTDGFWCKHEFDDGFEYIVESVGGGVRFRGKITSKQAANGIASEMAIDNKKDFLIYKCVGGAALEKTVSYRAVCSSFE